MAILSKDNVVQFPGKYKGNQIAIAMNKVAAESDCGFVLIGIRRTGDYSTAMSRVASFTSINDTIKFLELAIKSLEAGR